ncbi:hypothetical protein Ple7327_4411 [Pleurocapsa sp. PCC 7327]|nr:hypothetical protein Ple7327_4411 [Pleurocapsa sp. PCC 7327]
MTTFNCFFYILIVPKNLCQLTDRWLSDETQIAPTSTPLPERQRGFPLKTFA